MEKLDSEGKESKIMCIMEWLPWACGVNSTGNLGDSMENASELFSPISSLPRVQEEENLSFDSHPSLAQCCSPRALISWHLWLIAHN